MPAPTCGCRARDRGRGNRTIPADARGLCVQRQNLRQPLPRQWSRRPQPQMLTIALDLERGIAVRAGERIGLDLGLAVVAQPEFVCHAGRVAGERPELAGTRAPQHRIARDHPLLDKAGKRRVAASRTKGHTLIPDLPRPHLILRRLTAQRIKASVARTAPP